VLVGQRSTDCLTVGTIRHCGLTVFTTSTNGNVLQRRMFRHGNDGALPMSGAMARATRLGDLAWRFDDLTGKKFGRLRVLGRDGKDCSGQIRFRCRCSCGREVIIVGTSLRMQRTISYGCNMASVTMGGPISEAASF